MSWWRRVACASGSFLWCAALCVAGQQSAIDPAGPQSAKIATLWWFFFWTLGAIFLVVMLATLWTLTRPNRGLQQEPLEGTHSASPETDHKVNRAVGGATVLTIIILFILIIASVRTGKAVSELHKDNALTIEVTGVQWWWQVSYQNSNASDMVTTANEIHIPVGRPVQIRGLSNDVIHSFWVPNLNGKIDFIPSRVNTQWIQADHPGLYRGQCAEFCGLQHAHMIIYVIAEPEEQFRKWYRAQLQPAIEPADEDARRGRTVFMNNACIYCHQIRGTEAGGRNGPDLTHFGSRLGIAANTVPNTRGNLGGWIVDPQSTKPGNHMATIAVNSTDLPPLIGYLESLK